MARNSRLILFVALIIKMFWPIQLQPSLKRMKLKSFGFKFCALSVESSPWLIIDSKWMSRK